MKVLHLTVGAIGTNCFIVYDEKSLEGIVIDPGDNAKNILEAVNKNDVKIKYVVLTHGHFDHILATDEVCQATGAKLVMHSADKRFITENYVAQYKSFLKGKYTEKAVDVEIADGDFITFGDLKADFIHTPGHTPGSCVVRINDLLFTGDTMFRGECGRCDLDGGNFDTILISLKKLADLDGNYEVLPGHEDFSNLAWERKHNKYVLMANS